MHKARLYVFKATPVGAGPVTHIWRWQLVARNGRIYADSGEAYTTKRKCLHGARLMLSCTDQNTKIVIEDI